MPKISNLPAITEAIRTDVLPIVSGGDTTKITLEQMRGGEVSVVDYGAVGDGATDDSTAFQDAINDVNTAGGGIVLVPANTYIVEGLTLYNGVHIVGQGAAEFANAGTVLKLPASPSSDMFTFNTQEDVEGGGIHNLYANGINSTYDFVSFENVTDDIFLFELSNNWIVNFRRGFDSEGADCRNPRINGNKFSNCTAGVYVGAEHPLFESMNEFRDCTAGITGSMIHAVINNQKFAYCTDAVVPAAGDTITASTFVGNSVYYCTRGITVDSRCNIVGHLFGPINTSESLIVVKGDIVNIVGNGFYEESNTYKCSEACIIIDNSGSVRRDINIEGNSGQLEGTFLYVDSSSNAIKSLSMTGNDILYLGNGKFLDDNGAQVIYYGIRDNILTTSNNSFDDSTTLISLLNNLGAGGIITGNQFAATEGGDNDEWIAFDVDARRVVIANNNWRRGGLYIDDSDNNTVLANNVLVDNVKTGAGAADTIGYNLLDGSGGAFTLTLADGTTDGDPMHFTMIAAGNNVTVSVTNHQSGSPTNFVFNSVGDSLELSWNATSGHWTTVRSDGV